MGTQRRQHWKLLLDVGLILLVATVNLLFGNHWRLTDALWALTIIPGIRWVYAYQEWQAAVGQVVVAVVMIDVGLLLHRWDRTPYRDMTEVIITCIMVSFAVNIFYARRLKQAHQELNDLATRDSLTNLLNRRFLAFFLNQECERSQRYDHVFSVLMIDIDRFKTINDRYGHLNGDDILRRTADILRGIIRSIDLPFRYGGEEFLILLPAIDAAQALVIADRLRVAVEEAYAVLDGIDVRWTISLGVATWQTGEDPMNMVRRADAALYQAKSNGRNCVRVGDAHVPEYT